MRVAGGYDTIIKVCEAFGKVAKEHIAEYGEGNDKRLTGKHETCDINTFKHLARDLLQILQILHISSTVWPIVAHPSASLAMLRKSGRGYMEDRRPAANCDPYRVTQQRNVTQIIMKTTGECLSAETIEAGGKTHTAFVFIKPHADKKKLIDTHYGAIAAKAVMMKPKDLVVQEKSQEEFEKMFGVKWSKVMEDGLVFNAMDGAKKLGISPDELGKKYDALKKGETIIKFGGGFYCGKVEWPAEKMSWADFRGKLLGPTDPASAPEGSLRQQIYSKWSELGRSAKGQMFKWCVVIVECNIG
eukprot:s3967_g8.t1